MVVVRPKFKSADIKKYLDQRMATIEEAIISRLQRVGETFVRNARSTNTYRDQTGNLRSSIGYVIMKNGVQLFENYERRGQGRKYGGKHGEEGEQKAQAVIAQAKGQHPSGFVLIVVAGMEYALAVESRGKDVLTGSSQIAVDDLKKAMAALNKKISR